MKLNYKGMTVYQFLKTIRKKIKLPRLFKKYDSGITTKSNLKTTKLSKFNFELKRWCF